MATKHYLSLSVNERINLRSGFDIAVANESEEYNRFKESTLIGEIAKKISQVEYSMDRFYCSLRTLYPNKSLAV